MKRDNRLYVLQIIENAELIHEHMQEVTWEAFQKDKMLQAAMERWLIIIGEASKRLSTRFVEANDDVPWHMIKGLRNIVVHEYDSMDLTMIYDVLSIHVPDLLDEMLAVKKSGNFHD